MRLTSLKPGAAAALTAVLLLAPGVRPAAAQAVVNVEVDSLDLPQAVVVGNRAEVALQSVGHTFDVITRAELERLPINTVTEALQFVPGLDLRQRGPLGVQADLSIRGGTFDQVLVLINGIRMADPQTGHHVLNIPIPLENVERIEVLKGPGARLYGQNAFAGAINIVTRPGAERSTTLRASAGEFGAGGFGVSLDAPAGPLRQTFSFQRDFADGYRAAGVDSLRLNTDSRLSHAFYQAELASGRDVFGVVAGLADRAFGANGFYASASATQQYEEITTGIVALSHRRTSADDGAGSFSQRLSYRRNRDDYVFVRSNPSLYQNVHTSQVLSWDGYYARPTPLGRLGVAAELRGVALESNLLGERERVTANGLVEHEFTWFGGDLAATPGVSVNWLSDGGARVLPGFDVRYGAAPGLELYGNVGTTFRVPTYTDLYYEDRFNAGNPDLAAETAAAYELGASYAHGGFTTGVAVWRREADDLIDYVLDSPADTVWQPRNFTEATFQGIEVKAALRRHTPWLPLLQASYAYIDASLPGGGGGFVSRYALDNLVHQVASTAVVRPWPRWSATLGFRVGDRVDPPGAGENAAAPEVDYALLDARVDYRRRSVRAFAEATNLTDQAYAQANGVPLPGRWIRIGASVRW